MASPAIDMTYAYRGHSAVRSDGRSDIVALATSFDADIAEPLFFQGRMRRPAQTSQLMLAVSRVALSRYYVPPAMVARLIRNADPVVTVAGEQIRFESFSQCCGVYARLDLLPDSLDGEFGRHGTTNVDFNEPMRAALAGIRGLDDAGLTIGADHVGLETDGCGIIERKVPLPVRWLKGFVESQVYAARLALKAEISGPQARRFLASLSNSVRGGDLVHLEGSGGQLRLSRRAGADTMAANGLGRLQILKTIARLAERLRVYGDESSGVSAWELVFDGARFTLILSPDAARGFSGEGQVLDTLSAAGSANAVARFRAALAWQTDIGVADLSDLGADEAELQAALAVLGSQGLVGFDAHTKRYFHRELPFDMNIVETLHPRLISARKLIEQGAVEMISDGQDGIVAFVAGSGTRHHVREAPDGMSCTCDWFSKHRNSRGPCKHVLAAQIMREEQGHES